MTKGQNKKQCPYCGLIVDMENHDCPKLRSIKNKQQRIRNKNDESTNKELKTRYWGRFRKIIILMDKGECQRCLIKFHKHTFNDLTVHHIKPRIDYPELMYDEDNCITMCRTCNLSMGLSGIDFDWNPAHREKIEPTL